MNLIIPNMIPATISKQLTWSAFDHIFSETDWRLRIQSLSPLSFSVEYDDGFASCLSGNQSWQNKHQALSWIAHRVLSLAASFDKTLIRRLSLQVPKTHDAPVGAALLSNLERRIRDTILDELVTHFDTSISDWETSIQFEIAGLDDTNARWHASRYVGLDQLVSVDAVRKAIRFVFHRTHWWLTEDNDRTLLNLDWRFEQVRAQRTSLNEQTQARSLVARCIEVLVEDHVREQRAGLDVAPMTRLRLKCEIDRRFAERGCWGLVDLALPRDRARHYLRAPEGLGEHLRGLLAKQDQRMGVG